MTPRLPRIAEELLRLRLLLDAALTPSGVPARDEPAAACLKAEYSRWHKPFANGVAKPYPLGECHSITSALFSYVRSHAVLDPESGFHGLGTFLAEGGAFRIIWGEVRHAYFQTALQLGAWYVDVANDTVDIRKPKISMARLHAPECEFSTVDSVEQYARIKASYHACDIRYNHLFPDLAPCHPLLIRDHATGRFFLDDSRHVAALMIEQDFAFLRARALPLLEAQEVAGIQGLLARAGKTAPIPGWLRCEVLDFRRLHGISHQAQAPDLQATRILRRRVAYLNHFLMSA